MSTCVVREISCPQCGAVNKKQMWTGIGAGANPELRQRILNGTLFDFKCSQCGYEARMVYPCLYHDRERGLMVCLLPGDGMEAPGNVAERYPQLKNVKKRAVASPEELKEKILIFEAGLDDAAVELVKYALRESVEKKLGIAAGPGMFAGADREAGTVRFDFFPEGAPEPVSREIKMDIYEKSLEILRETGYQESGAFETVDQRLAERLLAEYQG